LAFLDEEQEVAAPDEPERPRRRVGGADRRRQQFLLRRLIAVGIGLALLILIVIGFRGCLEARSDRGLRNYAQDVSTIMAESEQRGKDFFELLQSPGSPIEFQNQVRSLRSASESLLDRAENLSVPDQMAGPQSAVDQSLTLRRDALETIAENITQSAPAPAAGRGEAASTEQAEAIEAITEEMGSLFASDVLWTQIASPEISATLDDEQVDAPDLPAGIFMPESTPAEYLDQGKVVEVFGGVTGTEATAGSHGLGIVQTSMGDTTLSADSTTTVPDNAREIEVEVENQGEADEGGISVTVTFDGETLEGTIDELTAGDTQAVRIPITTLPQPGAEAQLEVAVTPVPGEQVTDNNQAGYTVVFGSASG
jgi:CARDB